MLLFRFICALSWAVNLDIAAASPPLHDLGLIRGRNVQARSDTDTLRAIRRALARAKLQGRDQDLKNSTSLSKSWDDTVLFSYKGSGTVRDANTSVSAGVQITCTKCYVKGTATVQLTIDGNFNASKAFHDTIDQIGEDVQNITKSAVKHVADYFEGLATNASTLSIEDLEFPSIPLDFDIDLPDIPQCRLRFQFDGMELYMALETVLSAGATYTLNLYKSITPLGIAVGDLQLGVTLSIDLILSVESEISISSGFHIRLEDGISLDMSMFDKSVSRITFNGGQFEFLPVTIENAGTVLKAVLRVGAHAGFETASPDFPVAFDLAVPTVSGGVQASVFADVAEFVTNVTVAPDGDKCGLLIEESYQMALGAAAGASVAVGERTWGPTPNTTIPIWYTTIRNACASRSSSATAAAAATSTPALAPRAAADMTTTTISTKVVYTGVNCRSSGLVNCPASLQDTSQLTTTTTLVATIPSGSEATFPPTTKSEVSTVTFGPNAHKLVATSGSPVSYVPPPPPPTSTGTTTTPPPGSPGSITGKAGGPSKRVIIGLSVGLGVPVLLAVLAAGFCFYTRRRYSPVPKADGTYAHRAVRTPQLGARKPGDSVVESVREIL